ncbi:MAG: NnrU family protein [Geminicoccaceae bacterium]
MLAAVFLLASHLGIASSGLRPWLVQRLGARLYLGAYSVLALAAIIWLVRAYNRADFVLLWSPAPWQAWLPLIIMPFALLFLFGGLTTPNPTVAGQALVEKKIDPPKGMLRITRHPTMWAFGLWALSHLIANGDLASLFLFGTIAALALVGTVLIDARYRDRLSTHWSSFSEQTSNLPFAAIITGRQQFDFGEIGWWRVALALGLYIALLLIHPWLFSVSPFGIS